jgi:radical SAM protein (TIGR01212 family)
MVIKLKLFNNEKHYNTLSNYYKFKYNKKVIKISLNMNFTCPNKDGLKGYGGCTYCSKLGSGDFAGNKALPIEEQFRQIKEMMSKKWPDAYYIPYFQANTNTYAPLEVLKPLFLKATTLDPLVKGISIATRCDCLEQEKVDFLGELNKICPVQIELGLQTANEATSVRINRGHTNKEFIDAVKRLKEKNIEVVVHIMNGLPGETKNDMLNTISFVNSLGIDGVKIHELCIIKDTKMAREFEENPWHLPTLEEYVDLVCEQIAMLDPNIIIHRLSADAPLNDLIEPKWTIKKMVVMDEIDKKLRSLNLYQGDHFNK